jgi:hypothetical protein
MNDPVRRQAIAEQMRLENAKRKLSQANQTPPSAGVQSSLDLGASAAGDIIIQPLITKLREYYRAPDVTDNEVCHALHLTPKEIDDALATEGLTLDALKKQVRAQGAINVKIAQQREAERGKADARERQEEKLTGACNCEAVRREAALRAMSDDELRAQRAEYQRVIDFVKPIDGPLPPTVHIEPLTVSNLPTGDDNGTSDSELESTRAEHGPTVATPGQAERTLCIAPPGPEAAGEDHNNLPSGPVARDHAAIYRRA